MPPHINGSQPFSQAELLLQSALDALPAHVAMLDDEGHIIRVNAAWREFADENDYRGTNHAMGANYLRICDEAQGRDAAQAAVVGRGIRDIMDERQRRFIIEYPCHGPADERWFTLQVTRFVWDGRMRLITAHQNVTDLRKVQQDLADSEYRLRTVLNAVVDGIFTTDANGLIESANPAAQAIFGEDITGKPIGALMPEPYRSQYQQYIRRPLRHHGHSRAEVGHEVTGLRAAGSTFPMYLALNRAYLGDRWVFTGIVQDLTPRKIIEQDRLEKEKLEIALEKEREMRELKNRFMSMISHELRTPLSIIMLSSDFMRRYADQMSEEDKLECIMTIQTQVRHLENMVDDVGTLSRTDDAELDMHAEPFDLLDLCTDIVANMQMLAGNPQRITFDVNGACHDIFADRKLLRQAINNLISNALKYSSAETAVNITLDCTPDGYVLDIADHGIGIPVIDQPALFQPFHRASNVGSTQGTGLGLAVTKQAVEMHGGSITFNSTEGIGTTFRITLPNS